MLFDSAFTPTTPFGFELRAAANEHRLAVQYDQPYNLLDMDAKGRARRSNPRPGEKHHGARLTEQDVLFIREARKNGVSPYKLASDFGVSYFNINLIVKRKRWSHI